MDEHRRHIYAGEPDEDLIEALEPDQLVSAMDLPVTRRKLSRAMSTGLWALRVFLLLVTTLVVYAFVVGILRG